MPCDAFFRLLARLLPTRESPVFKAWPWSPAVSLMLFVHRVDGLAPGLYMLVRNPEHLPPLRDQMDQRFGWQPPAGCPKALPLFCLAPADVQDAARTICCTQDIASDGAFAVAMLAQMRTHLDEHGPWFYPRLFWETGMIGQMLYLEAEACGLRGTGIGCFFDDLLHRLLGLEPQGDWQSLYHFTVGGPVDDPRIQTWAPYAGRAR